MLYCPVYNTIAIYYHVVFSPSLSHSRVTTLSTTSMVVLLLSRKENLNAAIAISEVVRTSLGPHAKSKLLVSDTGHVTSTNDGYTVLKGLPVEHPIGELIVQLSSGQDDAIGDGTTSVIVFFGALCKKALYLLDKCVHPALIIDGFQQASQLALSELSLISEQQHKTEKDNNNNTNNMQEITSNENNSDIPVIDDQLLHFLAHTALHSKVAEIDRARIAGICIDAIKLSKNNSKWIFGAHGISVQKLEGGSLENTRLLRGMILMSKVFTHQEMPKKIVGNGKKNIAVLSCSLDLPRPKSQFSLNATSNEGFETLNQLSIIHAQNTLSNLKKLEVEVVFCQWGIDPYLSELLASNGIVAVQWVAGNDLEKIAITVNALICPYLPTLTSSMLGSSPMICEIGGESPYLEIEGSSLTIIARGPETVAESAMISIHDALFVLENAYSDPRTVVGGGATEIALYTRILEHTSNIKSTKRYVMTCWAEALLSVPTTLAENASFSAPDVISQLIAQHKLGFVTLGVGSESPVVDISKVGIWELLKMKLSIISLATETACHIIKIDKGIILK